MRKVIFFLCVMGLFISNSFAYEEWIDGIAVGSSLQTQADVDDSSIADGYILKWNSTTEKHEYGAESGGGTGDHVTVNGTAIDTTANFLDGDIIWAVADGGAGGPDNITGAVLAGAIHDLTVDAKEKNTSAIVKGQTVYVSGSAGAGQTLIGLIDNTDSTKIRALGLAASAFAQNGTGTVRFRGELSGVDTLGTNAVNPNGETWAAGDILYCTNGGSGGGLTNVEPTSGRIIRAGYSLVGSHNNDTILVQPHENPICLATASGEDICIRMGDNIGANKTCFRDYANNIVACIDSNGIISTVLGFDAIGAISIPYGSVDVTDHTFTTDGTGDGEIVLPDDSIGPAEIDSTTGAYDFGGVTSFEFPNTAGDVTVNALGEIAVDTTQKQLAVYDGVEKAIPLRHMIQGQLGTGDYDADPDVWVRDLHADTYPDGIVITSWTVDCNEADPTTELNANIYYCDDRGAGAFPGASPVLVDVIDTTTGNSSEATMANSDLGSGVIPTGKELYIIIDADPTSDTTLFRTKIHFYIPES